MERHTCKLCFRGFANGRALGGHMRSHVVATTKAAAAAATATAATPTHFSLSASLSSTYNSDDEDGYGKRESDLGYGLRENPRKSSRVADPDSFVQDRESETESSRLPIHRIRSKRARSAATDPEPASSVSDATPEEDVALSLMMLSRDTWKSSEADEEEDEEEMMEEQPTTKKSKSKYQCKTCKKVFRSYQALGGHRASHKKFKTCFPLANASSSPSIQIHEEAANAEKAEHECPICFRVFASGQALGGHKRSHGSPVTANVTIPASVTVAVTPQAAPFRLRDSLIDLNLPAPMEEDADQLSAVSDELNWVQIGN